MADRPFGRAEIIRYAACKPLDFPEFLRVIINSPMPTWTGMIQEEPKEDPPFDHTMVCTAAHLMPRFRLPDGRVRVRLRYEERLA